MWKKNILNFKMYKTSDMCKYCFLEPMFSTLLKRKRLQGAGFDGFQVANLRSDPICLVHHPLLWKLLFRIFSTNWNLFYNFLISLLTERQFTDNLINWRTESAMHQANLFKGVWDLHLRMSSTGTVTAVGWPQRWTELLYTGAFLKYILLFPLRTLIIVKLFQLLIIPLS